MAYRLEAFSDVGLDEALLKVVTDEHASALPRLERLWSYYRNPLRAVGDSGGRPGRAGRWYRLAQEAGLPSRIVGPNAALADDRVVTRREVVVENDIAWRVQAMVDFMFGKPVTILSTARDESTRRRIEAILDAVWESSGGIALLQDMALLGHVYGWADLMLRVSPAATDLALRAPDELTGALRAAGSVRVELIEPRRGAAVMDPDDYRRLSAYVIRFEQELNEATGDGAVGGLARGAGRAIAMLIKGPWDASGVGASRGRRRVAEVTEIVSGASRQVYVDGELTEEQSLAFMKGRVPVVHMQNVAQPFQYEGLSEVEPLIPLQDELNTRLSDRASRVTMQSFKMYLARGIEGFETSQVGPGVIWSTDNPSATVQEFGGDGDSPSEAAHIQDVREALDKVSGVPPVASGVVRAKIGNLTSANALRITLMGVLSKTARKRVTYGRGIAEMCRLILTALDSLGVYRTDEADRGVKLEWPDPLPIDVREQVAAARAKADLGVPAERVLAELGYAPNDPGVQ